MSSVSWMHGMKQRSTELDRFCPTTTSPRYNVAQQEAACRLCSASATSQWMQSISVSTEHPTADVKMLLSTIFIAERKNQHFLYCSACCGMLMVPTFHCCTHQYGKATRPFKLQPWLFMPYLALACSQVSLRMYGRPKRERCCIEKCHAREKTVYQGSLLRRGIWLAHSLHKLLEIHSKKQITAAARAQHRGEEQEKCMQGLIETLEDWIWRT